MTCGREKASRDFGLRLQPMVHVKDLSTAIEFYELLGGRLMFGSRDGDWALVDFDGTALGLLAHEPGDTAPDRVELHFTSRTPLEAIEEYLKSHAPARIDRGVGDEAFGKMLKLRTPDGLLVKLVQIERDLVEG